MKKAKFNTKLCIGFGTKTTFIVLVPEHVLLGPKQRYFGPFGILLISFIWATQGVIFLPLGLINAHISAISSHKRQPRAFYH